MWSHHYGIWSGVNPNATPTRRALGTSQSGCTHQYKPPQMPGRDDLRHFRTPGPKRRAQWCQWCQWGRKFEVRQPSSSSWHHPTHSPGVSEHDLVIDLRRFSTPTPQNSSFWGPNRPPAGPGVKKWRKSSLPDIWGGVYWVLHPIRLVPSARRVRVALGLTPDQIW